MRNKLIAVVAASVLPLGFAASASANPTANHEVTFTVAEARSISVTVNGEGDVLEFGAIAQDSSVTLPDAVTVTVSSPEGTNDQVRVILLDAAVDGSATPPPTGVTLRATAKLISGGGGELRENVAVQQGFGVLYDGLLGLFLNQSFDVNFTLATTENAVAGTEQSFFIQYTLFDDPLPDPED